MINGLSSSEIVSELVNRIEALEALPHDTYVTQQQLLDAISNVASSQTITNINNAITLINNEITDLRNTITNIEGDITNIKTDITNIKNDIDGVKADMDLNELTTSAALNDLNSRIGYIEDFGIDFNPDLDYITAEEVTDIHSIVIDD